VDKCTQPCKRCNQNGQCVDECISPCSECRQNEYGKYVCESTCPEGQSPCYYGPDNQQCECYDPSCTWCDGSIGPRPVEVVDVGPDDICCEGRFDYFTVETSPMNAGVLSRVTWSWTGGGTGFPYSSNTYSIDFNSCGMQTVTASIDDCDTSKETQVYVCCKGEACCGEEHYDTSTQQCCDDFSPYFYYLCDINETCCHGECCDPEKCESCFFDIYCVVCGGDPNLTCRNGNCCCAPNGCGPCGGPDIIPDNPTGCDDTSFLGPCNAHDDCYGECGNNKGTCNSNFLDAMLEFCTGSNCGLPCFEAARAYYGAVDLGGQGAFDASQACSCG